MMINRRHFLSFVTAAAAMAILPLKAIAALPAKLTLTDEDWKKRLSPVEYHILREEGTERAFTSSLLNEKHIGTFTCAGCDLPLFSSTAKYDSGTGWPSFYESLPDALETKTDYKIGVPRTEYHCARCGGHHGHVFQDGPKPTGLRYCSNGAVLRFVSAEKG